MFGRATAEAIRMADEAKQASATALSRMEGHEKICTERQGHIIDDLKEIKEFLKRVMFGLLVAAALLVYNIFKLKGILP